MPNRSNRNLEQNFSKIMKNIIQLSFLKKMDFLEINAKNVIISFGIKIKIRKFVVIVIALALMDLLADKIVMERSILLVKFGIISNRPLLPKEFLAKK